MDNPLYVSQPDLPDIDEYFMQLKKPWDSKVLTNNGPYLCNLENELADFLNIKYITIFNNATTALGVGIKALNLNKQVITTPYSFVATVSSLLWSNVTPIFVDIDPKTMNIDPSRIEEAITDETQAIMPVHCYGLACDLDRIEEIAQKYKLKVIMVVDKYPFYNYLSKQFPSNSLSRLINLSYTQKLYSFFKNYARFKICNLLNN